MDDSTDNGSCHRAWVHSLAGRHSETGEGCCGAKQGRHSLCTVSARKRLLTVTVDNKGWTRMSKAQKVEFLERVNGSALSANGGIAIDIHVSMSGAKVATSTFAAGQQSFRLLE